MAAYLTVAAGGASSVAVECEGCCGWLAMGFVPIDVATAVADAVVISGSRVCELTCPPCFVTVGVSGVSVGVVWSAGVDDEMSRCVHGSSSV